MIFTEQLIEGNQSKDVDIFLFEFQIYEKSGLAKCLKVFQDYASLILISRLFQIVVPRFDRQCFP